MDAITLLTEDHRAVEALFAAYEATATAPADDADALAQCRTLVDQLIEALSVHAEIEERIFYPAARELAPEPAEVSLEGDVLEGLEEHHVVKWTLSELEDLPADHERFHPKVRVLMQLVRDHVASEERDVFPAIRAAVDPEELEALGERLAELKDHVPSRPHPRTPDAPPGNVVAGVGTRVLDQTKDALSSAVEAVRR